MDLSCRFHTRYSNAKALHRLNEQTYSIGAKQHEQAPCTIHLMTFAFFIALALLGFLMKSGALAVPGLIPEGRLKFLASPLPGPTHADRLRNLPRISKLWLILVLGSPLIWAYWKLLHEIQPGPILLAYLAAPIILMVGHVFHALVNLIWMPFGYQIPFLHRSPTRSRSLNDFWGNQWNLWFSDWFRDVLPPLLHWHDKRIAAGRLVVVFLISGLMHEAVVNLPFLLLHQKSVMGSMLLYFLIQGVGVLAERRFLKGRPITRRLFAWLMVLGPAPLFLNEAFLAILMLAPE